MRHSLLFALPFVGASISIILIWHSTTILRWEQIKVELILPIPQLGGDGSSRALWRRSRPPFDLSISVGPDVHAELPRGRAVSARGLGQSQHEEHAIHPSKASDRGSPFAQHKLFSCTFRHSVQRLQWSIYRNIPRRQGMQSFYVPWEDSQAWPLFLVLYNCGSGAEVRYVEMGASGDMGKMWKEGAVVNIQEERKYPRRDLYFRRRTGSGGKVTLCTQLTPERLHHLQHIAKHWGGPVSAAIYVGHRNSSQGDETTAISNFWDTAADDIKSFLDIHLVYDDKRPWFSTSAGGSRIHIQSIYFVRSPLMLLRRNG